MHRIHRGLLTGLMSSLALLLIGVLLKYQLLHNEYPYQPPTLSALFDWRLFAILGMGVFMGVLILRNYPWVRDEHIFEYVGIGISFMMLLSLITDIVLSWNDWYDLAYSVMVTGSIYSGLMGTGFVAAVIGEILYRWRRRK